MKAIGMMIKRPFIWLKRFRYRCGYGVHSPFAFQFITNVIYERLPYYAYEELAEAEKEDVENRPPEWYEEPMRLRKLLFRVTNFVQPGTIFYFGREQVSSLYMKEAVKQAKMIFEGDDQTTVSYNHPLMFYFTCWQQPERVRGVFERFIEQADGQSLFAIRGIGYSQEMKRLWNELKSNPRTGITFDLYDVGLIFLDHSKNKQHYIINF